MFAVRGPVDCVPLIGLLRDQPSEAVHVVALVADHVKVALLPLLIEVGLALNVIVGAGAVTETVADCDALPPAPVHVSI